MGRDAERKDGPPPTTCERFHRPVHTGRCGVDLALPRIARQGSDSRPACRGHPQVFCYQTRANKFFGFKCLRAMVRRNPHGIKYLQSHVGEGAHPFDRENPAARRACQVHPAGMHAGIATDQLAVVELETARVAGAGLQIDQQGYLKHTEWIDDDHSNDSRGARHTLNGYRPPAKLLAGRDRANRDRANIESFIAVRCSTCTSRSPATASCRPWSA